MLSYLTLYKIILLMKKLITTIAIAILMTGSFAACTKKSDTVAVATSVTLPAPAVNAPYTGSLSYTGTGGLPIANQSGTATISGSNPYTITFSDGVPPITNLRFADNGGGNYTTITESGSVAGMTVTTTKLTVGLTSSGATWAFSGTK